MLQLGLGSHSMVAHLLVRYALLPLRRASPLLSAEALGPCRAASRPERPGASQSAEALPRAPGRTFYGEPRHGAHGRRQGGSGRAPFSCHCLFSETVQGGRGRSQDQRRYAWAGSTSVTTQRGNSSHQCTLHTSTPCKHTSGPREGKIPGFSKRPQPTERGETKNAAEPNGTSASPCRLKYARLSSKPARAPRNAVSVAIT